MMSVLHRPSAWLAATLALTSLDGCLFPDYQIVDDAGPGASGGGGSGGSVAGDSGPGGSGGNTGSGGNAGSSGDASSGGDAASGGDAGMVACSPDSDDCPVGEYCDAQTLRCVSGCNDPSDCALSTDAGLGVDATALSCNVTTHRCVGCVGDAQCPGGQSCCTGTCFDTSSDPENCGDCARTCPPIANGTAGCVDSVCGVASCDTGYNEAGGACVPDTETCDNGVDDDGDSRVDCFDDGCGASPSCAGMCSDAATLGCNTRRTAQRTDAAGSTARIGPPGYSCGPSDRAGPEFAYRFTGAPDQAVFMELYGLDADLGLYLIETPPGAQCDAETSCLLAAESDPGTRPEVLAFTPLASVDYYVVVDGAQAGAFTLSVACSTPGGCFPARAIEAGQTISANNAVGGATNVTDNNVVYSCFGASHLGPEAAFIFAPTETRSYDVTVSNMTDNVSLFIVSGPTCGTTCLTPSSFSANPSTQDDSVVLSATAHTTYYIVVDSFSTNVSFDLTVTAL